MSLLHLFIVVAIFGFLDYIVETFIPMGSPFKIALRAIVVLAVILVVLDVVGGLPDIRVGSTHTETITIP